MRTIGITGGASIYKLGSAMEVQLFFECLNTYIVRGQAEDDWQILIDRFYKRYIRQNELDLAIKKMRMVQDSFKKISSQLIDLNHIDMITEKSKLNPSGATLAEVFEAYFEGFFYCAESAKLNFEAFKDYADYKYEPVRLIITDQPWFILEKNRLLSDYDNLDGEPFWCAK